MSRARADEISRGEATSCRSCHSADLVSVLNLGEQALTGVFPERRGEDAGAGPLELLWCSQCTLVQLGQSFSAKEMYGDNYGYRSGLNASMVQHLQRKVQALEELVDLQDGDIVLDIGSNDGTLLGAYGNPGVRRVGIDPTAAKFREYYAEGTEVVADFFSAPTYRSVARTEAKIITSIAMFYDLEEPVDFARQVAECLAPEGVWHLEQSYMPSMLRATSYDTICHEHVEYYSLRSLERILAEAGLAVVNVRFNRVNGGSFAVTATHEGSQKAESAALIDWFKRQEDRLDLFTPRPFREFEHRVFQHRADLMDLVAVIRQSGARLFGYGASTKGNVLLQFCGLGPDDVQAIAEVNEDKFGKFTPGTEIPIWSEGDVHDAEPDYLLVLPWHFREGIIEREREYLRRGGRLIFPLPEIEIVGD